MMGECTCRYLFMIQILLPVTKRFSGNSEAYASDFLENQEENIYISSVLHA